MPSSLAGHKCSLHASAPSGSPRATPIHLRRPSGLAHLNRWEKKDDILNSTYICRRLRVRHSVREEEKIPPPVPAATALPEKSRFAPEVVQRGEALHAKALAKTPDAKLDVWGSGFPAVQACLWIPEEDWDSFSPDDREALIVYLKSCIPAIRSSAARYTDIPSSAPAYARIKNNIANMRDDAFIIFTMFRRNGQWIQSRTVAKSE